MDKISKKIFIDLYSKMTAAELAETLGISERTVFNYAKKFGVKKQRGPQLKTQIID